MWRVHVEEGPAAIKVVIECQARPGTRTELKALVESISPTHGLKTPVLLGSTLHQALDNADGLVEIAEWAPAETQSAAVQQATDAGLCAPLV